MTFWMTRTDVEVLAAVPVKPFGVAKQRLAPEVAAGTRARLGKSIAARTARAAREAGAQVVIVTGDPSVARWATGLGHGVLWEEPTYGRGLNGAAATALAEAAARRVAWAIIHADLPIVTSSDLGEVFAACRESPVLAPSHDGGTNVVAGPGGDFTFRYGPGSFHRHLASVPHATIVARPGLALDLDSLADLRRAEALGGEWVMPGVLGT